jgi:hypothetical protein
MSAPAQIPGQPNVNDEHADGIGSSGTQQINLDRQRQPDRQALWSLAVGVPALVSVLRLWIEAGGDLQTTLLLVSNVGPINLLATFVVTAAWLVSAVVVVVLALGRLGREVPLPGHNRIPWYLWTVRWANRTPSWFAADQVAGMQPLGQFAPVGQVDLGDLSALQHVHGRGPYLLPWTCSRADHIGQCQPGKNGNPCRPNTTKHAMAGAVPVAKWVM